MDWRNQKRMNEWIWGGVLHHEATHYAYSSMPVCYFIPLRPKYLPQHPILKHPQAMFVPQFERPSFTSIQKIDKIIVLYVLIRIFMDNRLEDKRFSTKWQQAFPDFNLIFTQDPVLYGRKVLKWIWIEWVTVEVDLSVAG